MQISLMIEGQNGLNWTHWQHIVLAVEGLGFAGIFRSDHYTNATPPDKDSLELWISLTWVACNTQRIKFGPLVTPPSFRHPTMTARMASALDDLSGGRLVLGLGAGWQEREHHNFGLQLLNIDERFIRFRESLEVISLLLYSDDPVDYEGAYYELRQAILLPRPQRHGGPPILVGGNGKKRTLPLVAQLADGWNAVYLPPQEFIHLNHHLDELLRGEGREKGEVHRSLMTGCVFGQTQSEIEKKVALRTQNKRDVDQLRAHGVLVGDGPALRDQIAELEAAGVEQIMLQWLDLDDLAGIRALGQALIQ